MAKEIKPVVEKEKTFDLLDIRVGRIIEIEEEPSSLKKSYRLKVDFGKYGIRTSVGRFTQHNVDELKNKLVLGVLNFSPRTIGNTVSEVLIIGVQYPKAESGEATPVSPITDAKIGGKLF